jgi:hypothetical protein
MKIAYPMWVSKKGMTESEVNTLEANITVWRSHFRDNYAEYIKSKCNHIKFHALVHVPEDIREHGLPGNYCVHSWEQYHSIVKAASMHTNNRYVPEFQMMRYLRMQEHLERGHEQFALVQAMFEVRFQYLFLYLFYFFLIRMLAETTTLLQNAAKLLQQHLKHAKKKGRHFQQHLLLLLQTTSKDH